MRRTLASHIVFRTVSRCLFPPPFGFKVGVQPRRRWRMGVLSSSAALLVLLGACLDPWVQTYAPWALQLLSSWDAQSRDYDDRSADAPDRSADAPADGGGVLHHPPRVCRGAQPPAATATGGISTGFAAACGSEIRPGSGRRQPRRNHAVSQHWYHPRSANVRSASAGSAGPCYV